ncbi:MAG: helix-turn-helix transcriptional regulator [Leptospiraceae bacterium]|nr:helix-turn-helix transcriptional regulator [Leptospiraceae bacterium]
MNYTEEYQKFLKLFRKARKDAKLTQIQVEAILAQPQSYISKCESDEKKINVIELHRFAKIYKKSIDFFLKGV